MVKKKVVIEVLKSLEKKGYLTPQKVVEEASNTLSPIHDLFEWDDSEAAEKYRLWQARQLIITVKVKFQGRVTNAYWHTRVGINRGEVNGYYSTSRVLSDKEIYQQVLKSAILELEYWQQKYKDIIELKKVIQVKELNKAKSYLAS